MVKAEVIIENKKNLNLDLKDKKIIEALLNNSRTSIVKIAKTLGYSKEVVKYRIDKLKEENIITDFYAVIDSTKLGFNRFNIYLEFQTLSKENEKFIIDYLLKNKNISWIISTSGKWDFMIQVYTGSVLELDSVLIEISNELKGLLKRYEVYIVTEFHHLKFKFLTEDITIPKNIHGPYSKELESKVKSKIKIDKIDLDILKILENNSRAQILDIVKEINLSKDAVIHRIKRLVSQKIITDFLLRLNWHSLGYEYHSVLLKLKEIDKLKRGKLIHYLKSRKEVIAIFVQIGYWNLSIQCVVKNAMELKQFISDLKENFSEMIEDNDSVLYFNQYLFTYLPRVIIEDPKFLLHPSPN